MKKTVKIILILSILIFLTLLGIFIYQKISSKEPVVSVREQYQQEMIKGDEAQ